jgi:hypothetical protein
VRRKRGPVWVRQSRRRVAASVVIKWCVNSSDNAGQIYAAAVLAWSGWRTTFRAFPPRRLNTRTVPLPRHLINATLKITRRFSGCKMRIESRSTRSDAAEPATVGAALQVKPQHPAPSRSSETTTRSDQRPSTRHACRLFRDGKITEPRECPKVPASDQMNPLHRNLETTKQIVYRRGTSASLESLRLHSCLLCRSHPRSSVRLTASPTRIPLSVSTCGSRLSMSNPSSSPGPFWAYYSTPVSRTCRCCFHPHSVWTARSPGRGGVGAAS